MKFWFGRKKMVQALAEVLEDGREIMNQELSKSKYNQYSGNVPMIEIPVRVEPEAEPPFESIMKAGINQAYLLMQGVRVQVEYKAGEHKQVTMQDTDQAILDRNPQLIKSSE